MNWIKTKLASLNKRAWLGILIAAILGGIDAYNQANGTAITIPGWVIAFLAALGFTVNPAKK